MIPKDPPEDDEDEHTDQFAGRGKIELLWSVFSPSLLLTFVRGQKHFLCRHKRGEEKGRKQMSVSFLWSVISPSLLLTLVRRENAWSPA